MRKIFSFVLALAWIVIGAGLVTAASKKKADSKSTATSKAPSKSTKSGKAAPAKSTTKKSASSKGSKKSSSKKKTATTWRNRQAAPSSDRYKEIQDALVAKGYLTGDNATGVWGAASIDALKRFQSEQKLQASGKINSLSLIALGLGPKREPVALAKPQEPVAPAQAQPAR